jgi:hypothetical protein
LVAKNYNPRSSKLVLFNYPSYTSPLVRWKHNFIAFVHPNTTHLIIIPIIFSIVDFSNKKLSFYLVNINNRGSNRFNIFQYLLYFFYYVQMLKTPHCLIIQNVELLEFLFLFIFFFRKSAKILKPKFKKLKSAKIPPKVIDI